MQSDELVKYLVAKTYGGDERYDQFVRLIVHGVWGTERPKAVHLPYFKRPASEMQMTEVSLLLPVVRPPAQ